jgi:hypothetical protein
MGKKKKKRPINLKVYKGVDINELSIKAYWRSN